ncbi:uncharacterized protein LOC114539004 [Dendronephthya gigantea]|uniref:uncharacterized protein LOC114539004 n=1 Tax=Dendronephthya gigantea TaxID=151771 RepID=UPI00106B4D61|nr:uncharacterized protein LOC114539004 [Dendronephthya gigantea]
MVLVGAVILPHGTMSFDGQGSESSVKSCRDRHEGLPKDLQVQLSGLFDATTKACEEISELKPDIVMLHTPHGISLSKSIGIYMNNVAKGNALWNGKWDEFKVEVPIDTELATKIVEHFEEDEIDAQGVNSFARTEAPLRWGEVVPLWYLEREFKKSKQQPKYVILSQSMRRGNMGEDKLVIGKSLAKFLKKIETRVVLAVSGDLSHTHAHSYCDIPLYLPDPRWNLSHSDTAVVFDRAIEGWAISGDSNLIGSDAQLPSCDKAVLWDVSLAKAWLDQTIELQPQAKSCGIGGFIVLHGLLSQCDQKIYSKVFGRFAPTYYGMIAIVFSIC